MKSSSLSCVRRWALCCSCFLVLAVPGRAALLQIVVDNDFAILTGTDTSVLRLVYQNSVVWNSQIAAASTFDLTLDPGETTIYILGMGGGGQENISGKINNININTLSLTMSSDLRPFLSGYNNTDVADGTYSAQLADVQTAFPTLSFSGVSPSSAHTVPGAAGNGSGYIFADSTAVLLKVAASDLGLSASSVPEPGTWAAAALLVGAAGYVRWRRRSNS